MAHSKACAFARVRITGPDVHGARPHQGNNAAETAADITVAVRGVRANPFVPHSAKVTWIRAGTGLLNVIPGSCELGIDVRAAETAVLSELQDEIERRCRSIADASGTNVDMTWKDVVPAALVGPVRKPSWSRPLSRCRALTCSCRQARRQARTTSTATPFTDRSSRRLARRGTPRRGWHGRRWSRDLEL